MSKPVTIYPGYGFWGSPNNLGYSSGIDTLVGRLKQIGCRASPTIHYFDWDKQAGYIKQRAGTEHVVLLGHSMDANGITKIQDAVYPLPVDVLLSFDPQPTVFGVLPISLFGWGIKPIRDNVACAINFRSNNYGNPIAGHGYLSRADGNGKTKLNNVESHDLHTDIDDDTGLHAMCIEAVRPLLGT